MSGMTGVMGSEMTGNANGLENGSDLHGHTAKLISFENDIRVSGELQSATNFGARLQLEDDQDIPKRLSILVPTLELNVGCHVIWRHRNEVAVLFDKKVDLPD